MDCYATDVLANLLDFASVQGCSYFDSQPLNIAADCKGATDGTSPSKVAKKPSRPKLGSRTGRKLRSIATLCL